MHYINMVTLKIVFGILNVRISGRLVLSVKRRPLLKFVKSPFPSLRQLHAKKDAWEGRLGDRTLIVNWLLVLQNLRNLQKKNTNQGP